MSTETDGVTLTEAAREALGSLLFDIARNHDWPGDMADQFLASSWLADRLAAVQAERWEVATRLREQLDAAMLRNVEYLRRAESAERRLAKVEALADQWEADRSSPVLRHGLMVAADDLRDALDGTR